MFLLFFWGGFAIFGLMSRMTVLSFLALSFRRAGGPPTELEDILLSVDDLAVIKSFQLLLILDCRQFIYARFSLWGGWWQGSGVTILPVSYHYAVLEL